jgi:hypothetical protein
MFCCECTICDKADTWKIDDECRPGERAAGYLYKKAKNTMIWSKRYFVLKGTKLKYYLERDRQSEKGEIVLAGATASPSTTRPDTRKKFFFNISHPQCGVRELYTKSNSRRTQWCNRINEIANTLLQTCIYGKLLKQGGLTKNVWQERWCISTGDSIDYFADATDNQLKGTIIITNSPITPIKIKDKFCFELSASEGKGKKGNKKYVFATEREYDRDRWVDQLRKNSVPVPDPMLVDESLNGSLNPIQHSASSEKIESSNNQTDDDNESNEDPPNLFFQQTSKQSTKELSSVVSSSTSQSMTAGELSGYLQKKSPAVMKGWQKRYFRTEANGDISYFKNEEESRKVGGEIKGKILMTDIAPRGVAFNEKTLELTITTREKKIQLKAASLDEGTEWAQNIMAWMDIASAGRWNK